MSADIIKLLSVIVQVFIGIAIIYSGRVVARAQYTRSMQDAWNDYNKLALSDDRNMEVASLLFGKAGKSLDENRKLYLGLIVLNILQSSFTGMKHGLMDQEYSLENFKEILRPLLSNDDIYEISQARGYHPEFKKICKEMKQLL